MSYVLAAQPGEREQYDNEIKFGFERHFHTPVMRKVLSVVQRANGLNETMCLFGQFLS